MHIKKIFLSYLFFGFLPTFCFSQKQAIQLDTYKNWPEVNQGGISNDGEFAFYQILNYPISKNTFVLRSTTKKWAMEIVSLSNPKFNESSRYLLGMLPNDTLYHFDLQNHREKKILGIRGYELVMVGKKELLVLQYSNEALSIHELDGQEIISYSKVIQYKFSPDGQKLFIEQRANMGDDLVTCKWIDMVTLVEKMIYEGAATSALIFDDQGSQIAFMVNVKDSNNIFYYKVGSRKAQLLADNNSAGIKRSLTIEASGYWGFSKDGKRIFFSLKEQGVIDTGRSSKYEVWSYKDARLKSEYYDRFGKITTRPTSHYLTSVRIRDGFIQQLLHSDERVVGNTFNHDTDTLLFVESSFGPLGTVHDPNARIKYHLCQTERGAARQFIEDQKAPLSQISMSPKGKYIIYFDREQEGYFTYEIATGFIYAISGKISNDLYKSPVLQYDRNFKSALGITGWLKDDEAVIINGTYDLFKLDPRNRKEPVNLTQGIGRKEGIIFNLASGKLRGLIGTNGKLLLSAFNLRNKDFGFYEVSLAGIGTTQKLSMAPVYCNHLDILHTTMDANEFLKARDTDVYIIRTQRVDQAPNYFLSRDLKTFSPISNIQPQRAYNWMTSELHSYKDSTGNAYQGILYKPENFDPEVSYPIVFYYYERKSHLLNSFQSVELSMGNCSIALLVSKGYLVFLPDMHGDSGFDGNGALKSILAAVEHIEQFHYIDPHRMGIVGGSFGGFETNYIVTHTNRFAAAISDAGISNLLTFVTEILGGRIQEMPMEHFIKNQDDYLRNSPILYARNVKTPFLLVHNKKDGAVDYLQSQDFFLMLRSLKKKVWWLSYEGEGHSIFDVDNQLDYAIKVFSFFDYYLKNGSEPQWMKDHIESSYK